MQYSVEQWRANHRIWRCDSREGKQTCFVTLTLDSRVVPLKKTNQHNNNYLHYVKNYVNKSNLKLEHRASCKGEAGPNLVKCPKVANLLNRCGFAMDKPNWTMPQVSGERCNFRLASIESGICFRFTVQLNIFENTIFIFKEQQRSIKRGRN